MKHLWEVGDLIVAGSHYVQRIDAVECEHIARTSSTVNGGLVKADEVEFAGFVPVWRFKRSPYRDDKGNSQPAGAGLHFAVAPYSLPVLHAAHCAKRNCVWALRVSTELPCALCECTCGAGR